MQISSYLCELLKREDYLVILPKIKCDLCYAIQTLLPLHWSLGFQCSMRTTNPRSFFPIFADHLLTNEVAKIPSHHSVRMRSDH